MSGVNKNSLDKYISIAVNEYSWTVVVYEQHKNERGKINRKFKCIITPGLNLISNKNITHVFIADGIDFNLEHKSRLRDKNTNETCLILK